MLRTAAGLHPDQARCAIGKVPKEPYTAKFQAHDLTRVHVTQCNWKTFFAMSTPTTDAFMGMCFITNPFGCEWAVDVPPVGDLLRREASIPFPLPGFQLMMT